MVLSQILAHRFDRLQDYRLGPVSSLDVFGRLLTLHPGPKAQTDNLRPGSVCLSLREYLAARQMQQTECSHRQTLALSHKF